MHSLFRILFVRKLCCQFLYSPRFNNTFKNVWHLDSKSTSLWRKILGSQSQILSHSHRSCWTQLVLNPHRGSWYRSIRCRIGRYCALLQMKTSGLLSYFLSAVIYFLMWKSTIVIIEYAQACYFIAMTKCLTSFKRYVHNFTESPPLYVISRLMLDISGTQ